MAHKYKRATISLRSEQNHPARDDATYSNTWKNGPEVSALGFGAMARQNTAKHLASISRTLAGFFGILHKRIDVLLGKTKEP